MRGSCSPQSSRRTEDTASRQDTLLHSGCPKPFHLGSLSLGRIGRVVPQPSRDLRSTGSLLSLALHQFTGSPSEGGRSIAS